MLLACGTMVGSLPASGRAAARAVRPAGRRGQRPVRQAARSRHDRQGDRGVRLRADGRGRLPDGRLRLGGARGGQRRGAAHRTTSAGSACPTAMCCTPSATSSSPRSASTSKASPGPPSTWRSPPAGPAPSGTPAPTARPPSLEADPHHRARGVLRSILALVHPRRLCDPTRRCSSRDRADSPTCAGHSPRRPLRLVILGNGIKPEVHALAKAHGRRRHSSRRDRADRRRSFGRLQPLVAARRRGDRARRRRHRAARGPADGRPSHARARRQRRAGSASWPT